MRILRIIYDWPPPWQGLAPHPYELTVSQQKLGHSVSVICGRWPSAGAVKRPQGVAVYPLIREPLPGTLAITISPLLLVYYIFWRRKHKVDVIHSHGHFAMWIYGYRLLLKKFHKNAGELKTPLVVHFHNTVAGRWKAALDRGLSIKFYSKYLAWPLARLSDKWAVSAADICIFVSDKVKEEAIKLYGRDSNNCFVVESGVNTSLFRPVGTEEKEKTRLDLKLDVLDKILLNLGLMVERKNIHLLVEALKFLPDTYKLLLVGPGDSAYMQKVEDRIVDLKLARRVIRSGYTPYPQVPIAFQAADLFVLPSSWEGTPKVVMESLACGTPALVSGFKVSEDISGLYYLDNLDPQQIAQKIQEVVESSTGVDIGKVRHFYSWDMKAKQVDDIYASLKRL